MKEGQPDPVGIIAAVSESAQETGLKLAYYNLFLAEDAHLSGDRTSYFLHLSIAAGARQIAFENMQPDSLPGQEIL